MGGDPDLDFSTYVVQFVMLPNEHGNAARGEITTFMQLWKIIPGVDNSEMERDDKHRAVSVGDACIYKLLERDLDQERAYPKDPAKHTHKAENFIRYLLGQIHKFLHDLEAVPKRPPRTFAVYLQWHKPSPKEGKRDVTPGQFRRVRQAINAAYFSDGVRFRLVQDTYPHSLQIDTWAETYQDFQELAGDEFKIKVEHFAVVLWEFVSMESSARRLRIYAYRYSRVTNEYCRRPHKIEQIASYTEHFHEMPEDLVLKKTKRIKQKYPVTVFYTNIPEPQLFPESVELKTWHPTRVYSKGDEDIVDELCMMKSATDQYGVVLDAGSSGTRSFVYKWVRRFDSKCHPVLPKEMSTLLVENPTKNGGIAKLWDGGLKGLENRVARYLGELIQSPKETLRGRGVGGILIGKDAIAEMAERSSGKHNESSLHLSRIPLYVLATGGMRELKQRDGQGYLHLRNVLVNFLNRSGFLEPTYDTIPGEAEGIFAWIDANFATKNLTAPWAYKQKQPHGLVEMGGQTVQLAFTRMPGVDGIRKNPWGRYKGPLTHINLGPGLDYNVFAKTWGVLGNMAMWREHGARILELEGGFKDPCVPTNGKYEVDYQQITGEGNFLSTMKEAFEMFKCRDTACGAGDLCLARLQRGCLLNEVEGLKFDPQSQEIFIGVSSISHAMNNLDLDSLRVDEFFTKSRKRYGKPFQTLLEERQKKVKKEYADKNNGKEIPSGRLMDRMMKEQEFLLREMFTAGLTLTMILLGMGIPLGPYASGCVQLATVWFRVEERCLEAGVDPTPSLKIRLAEVAKAAFPDHFGGGGDYWLKKILKILLDCYFVADGEDQGGRIIDRLVNKSERDTNLGMDVELAGHVVEGLKWLKTEVKGINRKKYKGPYYNSDENTVNNNLRELCFEFVGKCLNWEKSAQIGATIMKGQKDASWTRGRMLLHSVGSTPQERSFDGWHTELVGNE